jgi:RNA polymerase sigma-70 factor (ECF subfamily)
LLIGAVFYVGASLFGRAVMVGAGRGCRGELGVGFGQEDVVEPFEVSDSEIVGAAREDPARFGVLFDRHFGAVYRFLARRVGTEVAEELAADVFVVAFRRLDGYDLARSSALPWLYGIAHNLLRRHRRSEYRRLRALRRLAVRSNPSDLLLLEDRAVAEMASADLLDRVCMSLAELPRRDRDPLLLHVWEGMSYEEIGDVLGIPIGTVRSRINRSRRRLRELVGLGGQEPDGESTRERSPNG